MPQASSLYERGRRRGGGAERQTQLLVRALAARGLDAVHIVYPIHDPLPPSGDGFAVLQRAPRGRLEPARVWRALAAADASSYVVRTATPALGIVAAFCRTHRRRLVFSGANDGDFTYETLDSSRVKAQLYTLGVRWADTVVVQSGRQLELAEKAFPSQRCIVEIPSFAELADPATGAATAFLWIGRLVDYKRAGRYLDLAAALPQVQFRMIPMIELSSPETAGAFRARAAGLANLEVLEAGPHRRTMDLIEQAVAVVNTSSLEGMPNVFLEAWARGVPVLSLDCDPDERISQHGLGIAAQGSWERFVQGARDMWRDRAERSAYGEATRGYIARTHSQEAVAARWEQVVTGEIPA